MLKKQNRLKASIAFDATYKNKNSVSDDFLILYAGRLKDDKNCPTRVGFVVSKKVHKRSVKRNRIKRLLRESIRLMFLNNETDIINKYLSLVFVVKNQTNETGVNKLDTLKLSDIQKKVVKLLEKLANKKI